MQVQQARWPPGAPRVAFPKDYVGKPVAVINAPVIGLLRPLEGPDCRPSTQPGETYRVSRRPDFIVADDSLTVRTGPVRYMLPPDYTSVVPEDKKRILRPTALDALNSAWEPKNNQHKWELLPADDAELPSSGACDRNDRPPPGSTRSCKGSNTCDGSGPLPGHTGSGRPGKTTGGASGKRPAKTTGPRHAPPRAPVPRGTHKAPFTRPSGRNVLHPAKGALSFTGTPNVGIPIYQPDNMPVYNKTSFATFTDYLGTVMPTIIDAHTRLLSTFNTSRKDEYLALCKTLRTSIKANEFVYNTQQNAGSLRNMADNWGDDILFCSIESPGNAQNVIPFGSIKSSGNAQNVSSKPTDIGETFVGISSTTNNLKQTDKFVLHSAQLDAQGLYNKESGVTVLTFRVFENNRAKATPKQNILFPTPNTGLLDSHGQPTKAVVRQSNDFVHIGQVKFDTNPSFSLRKKIQDRVDKNGRMISDRVVGYSLADEVVALDPSEYTFFDFTLVVETPKGILFSSVLRTDLGYNTADLFGWTDHQVDLYLFPTGSAAQPLRLTHENDTGAAAVAAEPTTIGDHLVDQLGFLLDFYRLMRKRDFFFTVTPQNKRH